MEYEATVRDVCNVFKELSGTNSDAHREAAVIVPFIRDHKWGVYEFRLLIDFHLNDSREKEYLLRPGNMHLRSIFNSARTGRLLDILNDLKRAAEFTKKLKEANANPDMRSNRIRLKCGTLFIQKFIKVQDSSVRSGFRWKQSQENLEAYENHHSQCMENYGRCMWTDPQLIERGIEPGWKEQNEIC